MLVFWLLLGCLASSQSLTEINAFYNDNISLPCTAIQGNTNYKTITWYKLNNKTGIIWKSNGMTKKYDKFYRAAEFGADDSLNLPLVRPEDGGTYQCEIWANVGEKNRDSLIRLNVSDCAAPVSLTITVPCSENVTNKTPQSHLYVEEISTRWSVTGFLLVYLIKISLSLIFIKEGKCLYVVLLMAVFWCTEALPLAVTAMLPVCLFPTMGILPSKIVCPQYFLETNFLFLSGLVMASAIEHWGLHRRIALKVLKIVGVKPAWLILGMMITSAFLSMWLSNTATTAMMLPIANAILESLFGDLETLKENCKITIEPESQSQVILQALPSEKQKLSVDRVHGMELCDGRTPEEIKLESLYQMKVWKGFLICIPYAASIGGTATLTGTAPNLILIGQLKSYFPDCDLINFGSWFAFAFPLMGVFLFLSWIWIAFLYGGLNTRLCSKKQDLRSQAEAKAEAVIDEDYKKLGPLNFAEGSILFFFMLFGVLLFTRDPKFVTGWSVFFNKGYVSDAVTGVTIVSALFFFPSQKPSLRWWGDSQASNVPYVPLLSWKKAQECVPWNIILLLGGGFAMAKGCEESGLAVWIGQYLRPLAQVPPAVAVILVTAFLATFTEFASNTATIIIFLPVIVELAKFVKVNPLYFMIPATTGCSFAFMLPVSTPPNSIAFASGHLEVKDMVKTGIVMNILGVLSVTLAINTWGLAMFNLDTFPDWARPANISSSIIDIHVPLVPTFNTTL